MIKNKATKVLAVIAITCTIFLTACASSTETTIKDITKTSESVYSSAEKVSDTNAPTYATPTSTLGDVSQLVSTITTKSAEMIVKLGNIGTSLQTLSATITTFKTESQKLLDKNIQLSQEDLETLKQVNQNLKTINSNINEKRTALEQEVATINANIKSVIQNTTTLTLDQIITAVEECYTRAYNAIEFVNTKVTEVNTLLTTAIETIQTYTNNSNQNAA